MTPRRPGDSPDWGGKRSRSGRPGLPPGERKVKVGIFLPPELQAWVLELSGKAGISQSKLITTALYEFRARLEGKSALDVLDRGGAQGDGRPGKDSEP